MSGASPGVCASERAGKRLSRSCMGGRPFCTVWMNCHALMLLQDTVFKLSSHGMRCGELSGDMNKEQRQNTMRRFQQGEYRALIVR